MAQKWPPSSDDVIITSSHHHDLTSSHHRIIASRDATYALQMAYYHNQSKDFFGGPNNKLAFFDPPTGEYKYAFCSIFQDLQDYLAEILQENMRLTAFFKLYKICILLHRCNLKIFAKNRFEKSAIFVKIQQKFRTCRKICKILPKFRQISKISSNFKNFRLKIW